MTNPIDRAGWLPIETMKIPNWNRAYKHLNSALPKDYFRQKFTAFRVGADAVVRQLRNLALAPANQNLVVGYAQLGTRTYPEAKSYGGL